jgi:dGTPase
LEGENKMSDGLFVKEDKVEWEIENLSDKATNSDSYASNRWIEEEDDIYRTSFQKDIERILYSNAFRRLRTKTQVLYDPLNQHNRTRLTHTIEVSQISRQISRALNLNEDLTEAIALGHDLGHTPFGHAGERVLNDKLEKIGGFSHNVQSVWVVERLYHGVKINGKIIPGLNLTYAVREGILKHTGVKTNLGELEKFNPENPPTMEGQVVRLSDSLAYLYHDIQDGIRNDFVTKDEIISTWENISGIENENWFHILIDDVIRFSNENDRVDFSPKLKEAYKSLKQIHKNKILRNPKVEEMDNKGAELVEQMFDLLKKHPELLPKTKSNNKKLKEFGLERVIIDYIQWLGDQIFEEVLNNHKRRLKK